MSRKRLNPLPAIPKDAPASMKRWMESVKESLEVRLGRRGDPGEAGVTFNDLVDAGLAQPYRLVNPKTGLPDLKPVPGDGGLPDYGPPPKPNVFQGVAFFGGVHLFWSEPTNRPDVVFTEIVRGDTIDREAGSEIGGSGGRQYVDIFNIPAATTFYYWARHINYRGDPGPWSDALEVTKQPDVGMLLEQLSGELADEPSDLGAPNETLILHAERFAIRTGETGSYAYPLITTTIDGQPAVALNTALIQEASIEEGMIGPISFGKITAADGTPVVTVGGRLKAKYVDADNLSVANATTFSGDVFSPDFVSGRSGWCILQSGYVEFNEAMIRGNLEVQSITVNGQSPFGALRVHTTTGLAGEFEVHGRMHDDNDWYESIYRIWHAAGQGYVEGMAAGSRLAITIYPRVLIQINSNVAYRTTYDEEGTDPSSDNTNPITERHTYPTGSTRARARAWARVLIDGAQVYHTGWVTIIDRVFYDYSGSIKMPGYDSGFNLEYTYPAYRSTSTIRIEYAVELYGEVHDGINLILGYTIDGTNNVTGDVLRLG